MTKPTLSKKGAARASSSSKIIEVAGRPDHPGTFISIESNEQKLGAYLGFNDVANLRLIAISWPVLKAMIRYEPISQHLSRNASFRLLHDAEMKYTDVDPDEKWPFLETEENNLLVQKKSRHLCCILLDLEMDLKSLPSSSNNTIIQRSYTVSFRNHNGHQKQPPDIDYEVKEGSLSLVNFPELGPRHNESRLESINRCWLLLRYFKWCQSTSGVWEKRFSATALRSKISINESHVPSWMLPPKKTVLPEAIKKTAAIAAADALPPLHLTILWDKDFKFKSKDMLDEALENAEGQGIDIPDTRQIATQDPRLLSSIEQFKDSIRRQFNCQAIPMDIFILSMSFNNTALSAGSQTLNLLKSDWSDTKSTFESQENSDFVLRVVFEALDDPTDPQIYESFDVPVAIDQFFATSTKDVVPLLHGITEVTNAAFNAGDLDNTNLSPPPEDVPRPEEVPVGGVPAWLDLVFASSIGGEDIGSAPNPKDKFPHPEHRDAMLAYYDGHDVTTPSALREWQRAALKKVTKNAQVAKAKLDKLPKDFTPAQKAAISAGEAKSSLVIMADEEEGQDGKIVRISLDEKYFSETNPWPDQRSCEGRKTIRSLADRI